MKKFFSFLSAVIVCVMAISCGGDDKAQTTTDAYSEDGKYEAIANAMKNKDWTAVDSLVEIVYLDKNNCDAQTLANLTIAYFTMLDQNTEINAKQQLDYINKAIECYDAAQSKDADAAKEVYEKSGKNIEALKGKYVEKKADFEKAAQKVVDVK